MSKQDDSELKDSDVSLYDQKFKEEFDDMIPTRDYTRNDADFNVLFNIIFINMKKSIININWDYKVKLIIKWKKKKMMINDDNFEPNNKYYPIENIH